MLSHEQFLQAINYSHGSVRDQIIHLINVDDLWFSELTGNEPSELLPPSGVDNRAIIRALWDEVELSMRVYLADL
jgi:uncharacterized damage-inducible protein DinB